MAEQPAMGFGALLRELRVEARLTQEELADAAALSPRSISDLERGVNRTARKDTAELLAGALGLAETVRPSFVAAARGRVPAAEALAVIQNETSGNRALAFTRNVWEGCPYLGLMPFQEQNATVFYGRGDLVGELVRRLAARLSQAELLLVTGESGTGKSSLLGAGLMPQLAAGALRPGSEEWPRRMIRPTGRPLRELATVLADVARTDPDSVYRSLIAVPGDAPMLVELAVRTATGRDAIATPDDWVEAALDTPRLVLVVDQFEELFTAAEDTDASRMEREAFIAALHAAATMPAGPQQLPAALIIIAVRADFLGELIAYPPLKAALDAGPFTVGPMSEAELRIAMTGPAAEADLAVEPSVVEAVIAELHEEAWGGIGSGVLPLMSQAMAATWESREGMALTLRAYRRAGGVADAVNRSAQAAYNSLTSQQQDAARLVFTQLTTISLDGQFERRRCSRIDLSPLGIPMADIDTVINVFSAQRLLVLGEDSVEISHDILLQTWKQLRDWLSDDQIDRTLYGQVVTDAQAWDINGRDPSYLYRPGRLATIDAAVTRWENVPTRYPPLSAAGKAFLGAAHRTARRSTRQRRSAFVILAVLTALAIVASVAAFFQRGAAVQQRDQAIRNQVIAEALQSGASDTSLAAQLNLVAYRLRPTQDLYSRLLDTENTPLVSPVAGNAGFVNAGAVSPDGHVLASGNSDGTIRLWDISVPTHPTSFGPPLTGEPGAGSVGGIDAILSVAFSRHGHILASGGNDGSIQFWDIADPVHPKRIGQFFGGQYVASLTFIPDGRMLADVGEADSAGTIQLWNVADPAYTRLLGQPLTGTSGISVESVAFNPDERTIATANSDGTIRLWNITDPAHPRPLPSSLTSTAAAQSLAFSPDGHMLASGGNGGAIRLWNVTDPAHPRPLGSGPVASGTVGSVAFSPDGLMLASGSLNGAVDLWDIADPAYPTLFDQLLTGDADAVDSVAFSPDGHTLASSSPRGTIRLWTLPQTVLADSTIGLNSVAFNPNGRTLASSGNGGAIRLWNVADPAPPRPFGPSLGGTVYAADSVAFSPDRRTLASGDSDGVIRLWDVANELLSRPVDQDL